MMKIIMEKKAKYCIIFLSLVLMILIINNVLATPSFYNPLSQIVISKDKLVSVDLDENNRIDNVEYASTVVNSMLYILNNR